MKIKTIIVEDELNSQELLLQFLTDYCPDVEVLAIAPGVALAKQVIQQHAPDLVFLDIELQDGTGFEVLEGFSNLDFITICITGYDQYSIQAIKHAAFDYILKPFSIIELKESIERVKARLPAWRILKELEEDKEAEQVNSFKEKLVLTSEKGSKVIHHDQILFLSADEPYSRLFLADNSKVLIHLALSKIKDQLPNSFFQVHRSHIINLKKVTEWEKGRGGKVVLENGECLPIAYRSKKNFVAAMEQLNFKKL